MKFKYLIALCFMSSSFNATAANSFKVCADPVNPPYSTKNQDGFENKIASLFAKELNETLEYTWFPQRIGFIRNTLNAFANEEAVDSKDFKCDVVMGVPEGYDQALTTTPYYRSTYVLLIAKGRGWDDITNPKQLIDLSLTRQQELKIAMFDRGPGTEWLQKIGLLDQGIPYQSMSGDGDNNVAMQLDADLKAKKIDMVVLWGPMAAYIAQQNPKNSYALLPMPQLTGIRFDFSMAMGVRRADKERKETLNKLIASKQKEIAAIISDYGVPLLPIEHKGDK
ncbi:MAG: quinoprotein dehydrogenase-associated putative ABC transporter substrate-binding protein [Methylococcaceae bacterium]